MHEGAKINDWTPVGANTPCTRKRIIEDEMHETAMTSNQYLFPAVPPVAEIAALPSFAAPAVHSSTGRYWRTLRHLRLSQLLYLGLHRTLGSNDIRRWPDAPTGIKAHGGLRHMAEWQPGLAREVILAGNVKFVDPLPAEDDVPWSLKEVRRRQIFHANYCDFLNIDLSSPHDEDLLRLATSIALSWCDQNPTGRESGWQPFFLSLRIVNWLKFLARNYLRAQEIGDGAQVDRVLSNLRVQVLSLESRLERELLANHFLKNAKALVFAGYLLEAPESSRWLILGQQILKQQIREQILPDGGHIERSPMYHAWVLDDLIDIQQLFDVCAPNDSECRLAVSDGVARMSRYLSEILHPDGEIPLLNDSQLNVTRPTGEILAEAGTAPGAPARSGIETHVLPETGYGIIRNYDSRSFLILDCGPLGPDYQPGHGHSDVLTYELTLHGQRVVVDTGVSSYEPGRERQYERSTAAHNTIRIDGADQAEVWGSFRVGVRPTVGRIAQGSTANGYFVRGQHFKYRRSRVDHSRAIGHFAGSFWIIADLLQGKGRHKAESFIHFHPSVQLMPHPGTRDFPSESMAPQWKLQFGENSYVLMARGGGVLTLTSAWYSPGFAIRLPQSVIHWTHDGTLPISMAYAIVPEDTSQASVNQAADQLITQLSENLSVQPPPAWNPSDVRTVSQNAPNSLS